MVTPRNLRGVAIPGLFDLERRRQISTQELQEELRRRQAESRERRQRELAAQERRQEISDVQEQRRAVLGSSRAREVARIELQRQREARQRIAPVSSIERIEPIPEIPREAPPVRREVLAKLTEEQIAQRVERGQVGAIQAAVVLRQRAREAATPQERQRIERTIQQTPRIAQVREAPALTERADRLERATVTEIADTLRQPGVSAKTLIQAGAPRERVREAEQRVIAQRGLAEFETAPRQFNIAQALRSRIPEQVIRQAGISNEVITLAKERNDSLERLEKLNIGVPLSKNDQRIRDILQETVTLTGAETQTFNKADLEKRYDRQRQELIRVYNQKVVDLVKEGKGERPITTREQFVQQNLGTRDGYVQTVLENQDNLKSLTAKGKEIGRFAKEVGLASIPIYGTIRTWDEDPNWARAASVALDVAFFIPIVGQVSAGVRTGKGFRAIAKETTISSIRAETLGQIEAVAHPIRTAKGLIQPSIDILNPRRVPTTSVANKDSTIRIPAEKEFETKFGGHEAYPFAVKIPAGSVEGLGVATVGASKAAGVAFPSNKAARDFLKGRDVATMRLVRGQDGNAFVGADTQGRRIEVKIPKAPFSKTVGAAAFHGTPDLRPYLPGLEVAGKEGGLFIAPTALTRFIRASATGKTAQLSPDVQRAIDRLPDKTKAALGINRVSDKPIPGALVIRDTAILKQLQGSGKFWRGTGEIELVIPNGTKLPPPSQFIKTRNEAGETLYLAIIGKPLSKAEIAKLKIVGLKESVGAIFQRPGTASARAFGTDDKRTARRMAQMSEEARRAEQLFIDADEARKAGRIADSDRLIQRASEMADRAADSLTRAQRRAGSAFQRRRIDPAVLYTGRQDIERALTESDLGRRPTRQEIESNKRRNSANTVIDARPRGIPDVPMERRKGGPPRDERISRIPDVPRTPEPPRRREEPRVPRIPGVPGMPPPGRRPPGGPPPDGRKPPEPPPGKRRPPPPPEPPPGRRPPPFDLPGDAEKALKPGEFPRIVTWRQGLVNITVDLDRGIRSFGKAKGTGKGITPDETFQVVTKDKTRPPTKEFAQGVVKLNVTPRKVFFTRRQLNQRKF